MKAIVTGLLIAAAAYVCMSYDVSIKISERTASAQCVDLPNCGN